MGGRSQPLKGTNVPALLNLPRGRSSVGVARGFFFIDSNLGQGLVDDFT